MTSNGRTVEAELVERAGSPLWKADLAAFSDRLGLASAHEKIPVVLSRLKTRSEEPGGNQCLSLLCIAHAAELSLCLGP